MLSPARSPTWVSPGSWAQPCGLWVGAAQSAQGPVAGRGPRQALLGLSLFLVSVASLGPPVLGSRTLPALGWACGVKAGRWQVRGHVAQQLWQPRSRGPRTPWTDRLIPMGRPRPRPGTGPATCGAEPDSESARAIGTRGAGAGAGGSWRIRMDFRGCTGEALIPLPLVSVPGSGSWRDGRHSIRGRQLQTRAAGGRPGTGGEAPAPEPALLTTTRCSSRGGGPGRPVGPLPARAGASVCRRWQDHSLPRCLSPASGAELDGGPAEYCQGGSR